MPDISWEHAAEARAALNAIVTDPEHGVAALSSAQTMSNLLKDLLPDAPKEKSILVAAAEAGLADTLREHVAQGMDPSTAVRLTASSFSSATPFTPEACSWVAGEMAVALGISQAGTGAGSGAPTAAGVDPQAMPTQINPIPGFGPAPTQPTPDLGQAQAQGYPTQVAPQAPGGWQQSGGDSPPGLGAAPPGGYGPGAPAGGYGQGTPAGGYGPGTPAGGYSPGTPAGGYGPGTPAGGYGPGTPAGGYGPGTPAGGYGPGLAGGYGPPGPGQVVGFGPGGRPPGRSGAKRGLLIGSAIVVVIIAIVVIAATLSSGGKPSAHGSSSPPHTPTVNPTTPTTPSTGVESLSTIMNPPGYDAVATNCQQAQTGGLNAAILTNRLFCTSTTVNAVPTSHIVVWAYQFDSYNDYLTGFAKVNSITGFKSAGAGSHCPPASSSAFASTTWFAKHNPRYGQSQQHGQILECFTEYTKTHQYQPLLIWTMPTQNVVFISRNEASGGTFTQLMNWWYHVSYG